MTYCVAVAVDGGLVFASDSRTNAGPDQVATYSKMHAFGDKDRQIVVMSAGNLATSQAVITQLKRDVEENASVNIRSVRDMAAAAEYVGDISHSQEEKHEKAVARAGFSAEATFIVGGQIGREPPQLFMVYPQGNYITTSEQTPFLQIGETKYGKAILDRIIKPSTTLDEAALCALVSLDSTMRSNVTVGPPIEILVYPKDTLKFDRYRLLNEDDPYLLTVKKAWNKKLLNAFSELPRLEWSSPQQKFGRV